MQKQEFYSNGKLLISGEYLVLKGARALAIPLKLGQDLQVKTHQSTDQAFLHWKAYEKNIFWFDIKLSMPNFELIETSDQLIGEKLIQILKIAYELNPSFLEKNYSYAVSSKMTFKKEWGLGSSSTLINNISDWANIDPYILLEKSFGGSGYDIACAYSDSPIFYKLNEGNSEIIKVNFDPIFKDNLYFVYLGEKQISAESIKQFESQEIYSEDDIAEISDISFEMTKVQNLVKFQALMLKHEKIISTILNKKRIKKERFSDFSGEIKSLGGWGGDFVLVATNKNYEYVKYYFTEKGLDVIFRYEELALGY